MSSFLENTFITIFGAIFGAALQIAIPSLERRRRIRSHADLVGIWRSSYLMESSGAWVDDDVNISFSGSKLIIKNSNNPQDDRYECTATIKNEEIVGEWRSLGGRAAGSVVLSIRPTGALMYGFYTGSKDSGERVFAAWVIGRTQRNLTEGRTLLIRQFLKFGDAATQTTESDAGTS